MSLHLVGVVWRSSWQLGSRRSPTPSRSSTAFSSAATCTNRPLKVDQSYNLKNFSTCITGSSTTLAGGGGGTGATKGTSTLGGGGTGASDTAPPIIGGTVAGGTSAC
ncbi:hypothetical protein Taro_029513 [Colocasia esculenta]|uniref:Uncharacterized protein n=1 Tax=Colocasia esculenta TaxID=4460 RepID=A0A843VTG3_COLES|nr:hypothetical protein [Colocasia esculenta]